MASDPTIRAAVEAAARRLCICDGECFETRHGMMHGPCEQDLPSARAAIAICRAHFAGLARAHGAAIRARINITDDEATAARFEQRALVADAIAEIIEGEV